MSIGGDFMLSIAQQIMASTPEAVIAAQEAAKQISEATADALRDNLKAEEEARRMAERIGEAAIKELDNQREAMLDQIGEWKSDVEDAIDGIYDTVTGRFSEEDAREAVSDQQRDVMEAQAALDAARADPEQAGDVANLEERLSDAQRELQRDYFRLFKTLMEQSGGGMATADMLALGAAAGLTEAQIWDLRNQYTALGNANASATAFGNAALTAEQIGAAVAAAIAGAAGPNVTLNSLVPDAAARQVLFAELDRWWRERQAGQ